jgi:hypothetical protein
MVITFLFSLGVFLSPSVIILYHTLGDLSRGFAKKNKKNFSKKPIDKHLSLWYNYYRKKEREVNTMAEIKRQLEVLEDEIWEMEMGRIDARNASKYYSLKVEAGNLRRQLREMAQ